MKYKMKLILGDWSGAGLGKTEAEIYEVNYPVEAVQQAYKDSCKLTGVQFNVNEDYTGLAKERGWEENQKYQIAAHYGDYKISEEAYTLLKEAGMDLDKSTIYEDDDDESVWIDDFSGLWWDFIKLSLPDLVYEEIKDDTPVINGYWNKNLNVGFAYGMYDL